MQPEPTPQLDVDHRFVVRYLIIVLNIQAQRHDQTAGLHGGDLPAS